VVIDLEERESETGEDLRMDVGVREKVAAVFAGRLDGLALHGPEWRLGPDETSLPMRPGTEGASADGGQAEGDAGVPFGAYADDLDIPLGGSDEPVA
jgi:hypothetical protein